MTELKIIRLVEQAMAIGSVFRKSPHAQTVLRKYQEIMTTGLM